MGYEVVGRLQGIGLRISTFQGFRDTGSGLMRSAGAPGFCLGRHVTVLNTINIAKSEAIYEQ